MSSRRQKSRNRNDQQDVFDVNSNNNAGNLEDFASMMYRAPGAGDELRKLESKPTRIKRLSLSQVQPDPTQARRVMPSVLRRQWIANPSDVVTVLNTWLEWANAEADQNDRPEINVPALLSRDTEEYKQGEPIPEEKPDDVGPIESGFRALIQLAASIRLHGLANPVTVVTLPDGKYQLETGERRLLAFNLLHMLPDYVNEQTFDTIPARVVEEKDLWRQAAENGARQDLNAISIARQLALLLMDIYKDTKPIAPWNPNLDENAWYSQVSDAKEFPIPYGRGSELAAAIGLKSANQIRQYRALLSLPKAVWELADELDWTEYRIREMLKVSRQRATELDKHDREILETLAQYEAGVIEVLPAGFGERKPMIPPRHRQSVVFSNQAASILNIDVEAGTVTFQLVEPEVLGRLHGIEFPTLTVKSDD